MSAQSVFSVTTYDAGAPALDDQLLTLIYEGLLEPQPWQGLLKALRARLECWHANIAFHRPGGPGVWFDSVVDSEPGVVVSQLEYCGKYASFDPIPYQSLIPGRIYRQSEICDGAHACYRDFLRVQGIDDFVMLPIEERSGMRAWLTLARKSTQAPFSAAECAFVLSLTTHFTAALRTFAALKAAELERDIYRSALDSFACGTLLIDQSGRIARVDTAAARLLENNIALSIVDSRLRAATRADDEELRDTITAAVRDSYSATPAYSRALRLSTCDSLTLLVRSIAPSASSANENTAAAVVYLTDTQAGSTASARQLIDLFGLSGMEAALALELVGGRTLAEAARALQLTEQTARTYSKHIFAKTGTHRQAELVRLILTSVAHLGT